MDLENFDPNLLNQARKVAKFMNKSVLEFIQWTVEMKLNDIKEDPINFLSYQVGPEKLLKLIFKEI